MLAAACALALVAAAGTAGPATAARPDGPAARESIVGGGGAGKGWSFAVGIRQRKLGFICTGSLVAPDKVLTAAHCVRRVKRKRLKVMVDSPWISGRRAGPRVRVRRVKIDPHYKPRRGIRDFAVITLRRAAAAAPVAIPTKREAAVATRAGRQLHSAGWGARSVWGFRLAQRLKATSERALADRRCRRAYKRGFDQASMLCVLGGPIGRIRSRFSFHTTTCSGDSGGPLLARTAAGPRLVGVTSAGPIPCGYGPSIYARVSNALRFIRRAVAAP